MNIFTGLRGSIIQILSVTFPASVHELRDTLHTNYQLAVTKQAIHKVLRQLCADNIVENDNGHYQLRHSFILALDSWVNNLKTDYFGGRNELYLVPKGRSRSFEASTLLELDSLWNSILHTRLTRDTRAHTPYVQIVSHAWFALCHFEDEVKVAELLTEHRSGFFTLVNGSNALDNWLARFYAGEKSHYRTRARPKAEDNDRHIAVLDDYIFECRYPTRIAVELDALFKQTTSLRQLDLSRLMSIAGHRDTFSLQLTNNRTRAAKLRKAILSEMRR